MTTTADQGRDKLLDRIRKMQAKAESLQNMGPEYEQEALTFASNVKKMLDKYKLSLSDLEMSQLNVTDPHDESYHEVGQSVTKAWIVDLAKIVAEAHFCRTLLYTRQKRISIIGRKLDREVAGFIFMTLFRYAENQSDAEARKFRRNLRKQVGSTTGDNRDYRAAWLRAFVIRVKERYEAEKIEAERAARTAGVSLIRLDNALVEAGEFMAKKHPKLGFVKTRERFSANDAGKAAGRAAGDRVNIRGTGIGGGGPAAKRLS